MISTAATTCRSARITENGACDNTGIDAARSRHDAVDYYMQHLDVVADLIKDGYLMRGYFCLSLMDNFEWRRATACASAFVHVDYDTQVRTVKKSGKWYSELAAQFPQAGNWAEERDRIRPNCLYGR